MAARWRDRGVCSFLSIPDAPGPHSLLSMEVFRATSAKHENGSIFLPFFPPGSMVNNSCNLGWKLLSPFNLETESGKMRKCAFFYLESTQEGGILYIYMLKIYVFCQTQDSELYFRSDFKPWSWWLWRFRYVFVNTYERWPTIHYSDAVGEVRVVSIVRTAGVCFLNLPGPLGLDQGLGFETGSTIWL